MSVVKREPVVQYRLYPVTKIKENTWNPNQMSADKDGALREDMKLGGPTAIDPILTASKRAVLKDPFIPEDVRIIIDGNHRLRIARALGWSKIREGFDPRITDGETARLISYAKNAERGEMDPYLQAVYFKWFVDRGWTHEKIAKKHRIDRTTVTKHLSLIKIDPQAREKLAKVPRITISHLEPIATLKPDQQRKLVKEMASEFRRESPSVRTIEHRVSRIKKEAEEAEKLRRAVEKAKFPKCPTCGKPARSDSWRRFPWVRCEEYHEWSLETGAPKPEVEKRAKAKAEGKPQLPKYIRTIHTLDDFREVLCECARSLIPNFKRIDTIRCDGTTDSGKEAHVSADLDQYRQTASLRVELDGQDFTLWVEPKTYKTGNLKKFKTAVKAFPELTKKKDLAKLEQRVKDLFEKFGHAAKARGDKKIRGRK